MVVAPAFNPAFNREVEAGGICEFETSLVYRTRFRTGSKVIQKNKNKKVDFTFVSITTKIWSKV